MKSMLLYDWQKALLGRLSVYQVDNSQACILAKIAQPVQIEQAYL
jgi:hypothetical protein